MHPLGREPRSSYPPGRWSFSLENTIALGLCLAVVLGSAAVIETDRLLSSSFLNDAVDRPAGPSAGRPRLLAVRSKPDLVCVVSLGGLRRDSIAPAPDGEEAPMPHLAAFADTCITFETALAQASAPLVSLKSLLNGLYPSSLILDGTGADQFSLDGLSEPGEFLEETFCEVPSTLASELASLGFRTAFFTDADGSAGEEPFAADFDHTQRSSQPTGETHPIFAEAAAWLSAQASAPTMLFVHVEDLLGMGLPKQAAVVEPERARRVYERRLRWIDRALADFLDQLRAGGQWDDALIVVTSDHGTSLGERGLVGHGALYIEQLLVPLVVKFPLDWHVQAREIEIPVELVDLAPTVLEICGRRTRELDGTSLVPTILRDVTGRQILVAQTVMGAAGARPTVRSAIEPGRWQVIHDATSGEFEFFALADDPRGLSPVPPGTMELPPFLEDLLFPPPDPGPAEPAGELAEAAVPLRALQR